MSARRQSCNSDRACILDRGNGFSINLIGEPGGRIKVLNLKGNGAIRTIMTADIGMAGKGGFKGMASFNKDIKCKCSWTNLWMLKCLYIINGNVISTVTCSDCPDYNINGRVRSWI